MATLHIAPNAAAGVGISTALADVGSHDTVLVEMIHAGRLIADGDPTIMGECRIFAPLR